MRSLGRIPATTRLLFAGLACLCLATTATVSLSTNLLRTTVERDTMARLESNMNVAEKLLSELGPVTILSNGKMFAGTVDLCNNALVDGIQALVGGVASVFQGDIRISTNVLLKNGKRAVATPLANPAVREALLVQHRPYRGVVDVLGRKYFSAYNPVVGTDGVQIGILYVGIDESAVMNAISRTQNVILIVSSGIIVAIGLLLSWLGGKLATQIAARQQQLEQAHSHLDTALAHMANGLSLWDSKNTLVLANKHLADILRLPPESIYPGMTFRDFIKIRFESGCFEDNDCNAIYHKRLSNISAGHPISFVDEGSNGRTTHVQIRPVKSGGWISTFEDVTERKRAEARVAFMAEHDGLTGLSNRRVFENRLHGLVNQGSPFALLLLDLDFFKTVNDRLGHPVGDDLLKAAAMRLQGAVRENDLVARLGGDEFAILQVGDTWPTDATTLASRVIDNLCKPFQLGANEVCVGASCGIAFPDPASRDAEQLLRQADVALYAAKSDGRCRYACFDHSMDAQLREREQFESDLRQALINKQLSVFYQPLIDVHNGCISSFEALLRWHHPSRGTVSPAEFIPVAEATGLIGAIGTWVLNRACHDAATWPDQVRVAVNLSALQFHDGDLVMAVRNALRESDLRADRLELEITESALVQDVAKVSQILHSLREVGVRIAMDDFGTGYSSLSYLQSFPFDKIKIDQSFVRGLSDSAGAGAIVRAVTTLAESLGMATVAEGVETSAQFNRVCAEGCGEVQGYLFSRPRPASEVADMFVAVDSYFQPESKQHRHERDIVNAAQEVALSGFCQQVGQG